MGDHLGLGSSAGWGVFGIAPAYFCGFCVLGVNGCMFLGSLASDLLGDLLWARFLSVLSALLFGLDFFSILLELSDLCLVLFLKMIWFCSLTFSYRDLYLCWYWD